MLKKPTKSFFIIAVAIMSALAIILNFIPSVQLPWGIKIDFVGTAWGLSYFLYGLSVALPVSILTSIYIIVSSAAGFMGGIIKFVTTVPMFLFPDLLLRLHFYSRFKIFNRFLQMIINSILSNAVRLLISTIVNLFWVLPTELKIAPQGVLSHYYGIIPLITFVARLDVPQGIVDIFVPWTLAFLLIPWILTFKLKRL